MKSFVGMILGLVGSLFSLLFAIVLGIFSVLVLLGKGALVDYNLSEKLIDFASSLGFWSIVLAVWFLIVGILGIIFSGMMNNPLKAKKGSLLCLIFGVLSFNLFMILGGIIALVVGGKTPETVSAPVSNPVKPPLKTPIVTKTP
jgi:hypothetical protein